MIEPKRLNRDWSERRTENRYKERFPLRVQGRDREGKFFVEVVLTENVSCSGACITLNREVPIGERLHIFLKKGLLQSQATVKTCWIKEYRGKWCLGVKFERSPKQWQWN